MRKRSKALAACGLGLAFACPAFPEIPPKNHMETTNIVVKPSVVLRHGADRFVGLNLNYVRDSDANRPKAKPLNDALKEMGVRWLRYPGGEKSDFYLWSQPPYEKPIPTSLGWYDKQKGVRMDFDEFIGHCKAVGAEPYIVAGYDSEKNTQVTKAKWLENAIAWVRYANVVRHYGVKYWEIGNENWNNHTGTPQELAGIVGEFSKAMKAVDPTIKVGASGDTDHWWSGFLPTGATNVDFLAVSNYNGWAWNKYEHYLQSPPPAVADTPFIALAAIDRYAPVADRQRLKVIASEINTKDYSDGGWPDANDLGHALVTFDALGRCMTDPRILTAMVWTTRWMEDEKARLAPFYALDPENGELPPAKAIRLWGQFALSEMVKTDSDQEQVVAYATRSDDGMLMTVWILNRSLAARDVHLAIDSPTRYEVKATWRLSGSGPLDETPTLSQVPIAKFEERLNCQPTSVTVLELSGG